MRDFVSMYDRNGSMLLEHWKHLRTANIIESAFATVRHRTVRTKGCLSNKTALAMISPRPPRRIGVVSTVITYYRNLSLE